MLPRLIVSLLAGSVVLPGLGNPTAQERGRELFVRRCSGCHSPDSNKEGPRLSGVYGRKAAGVAGFGYSDALRKLDMRWNDATLDRWLSDPEAMAPDTDMAFRLTDAEERRAIIAWLRSLGNRGR